MQKTLTSTSRALNKRSPIPGWDPKKWAEIKPPRPRVEPKTYSREDQAIFLRALELYHHEENPDPHAALNLLLEHLRSGHLAMGDFIEGLISVQFLKSEITRANQGDRDAALNVGLCYLNGYGFGSPTPSYALIYLFRAFKLSRTHEEKTFIMEAIEHQKADLYRTVKDKAKKKSPLSCLALGICYEFGIGCQVDKAQSFFQFVQAYCLEGNGTPESKIMKHGLAIYTGVDAILSCCERIADNPETTLPIFSETMALVYAYGFKDYTPSAQLATEYLIKSIELSRTIPKEVTQLIWRVASKKVDDLDTLLEALLAMKMIPRIYDLASNWKMSDNAYKMLVAFRIEAFLQAKVKEINVSELMPCCESFYKRLQSYSELNWLIEYLKPAVKHHPEIRRFANKCLHRAIEFKEASPEIIRLALPLLKKDLREKQLLRLINSGKGNIKDAVEWLEIVMVSPADPMRKYNGRKSPVEIADALSKDLNGWNSVKFKKCKKGSLKQFYRLTQENAKHFVIKTYMGAKTPQGYEAAATYFLQGEKEYTKMAPTAFKGLNANGRHLMAFYFFYTGGRSENPSSYCCLKASSLLLSHTHYEPDADELRKTPYAIEVIAYFMLANGLRPGAFDIENEKEEIKQRMEEMCRDPKFRAALEYMTQTVPEKIKDPSK